MGTSPNLISDLTFGPSLPIDETDRAYPAKIIRFEDGRVLAWVRATTKLREFSLVWENLTKAEVASLVAFYDARYGPYGLFYFDHPQTGETDIKVRFVEGSFRISHTSPLVGTVSARLRECL